MRRLIKRIIKTVGSIMLLAVISVLAYVKVIPPSLQAGDKIIIAKGDIPTPAKYNVAIESYLKFVIAESAKMIFHLKVVKKQLKIGDLEKAQQAFIKAHQHYEAIRAIVILFGNVDRTINAQADYFLDGVVDYRFRGFYLVEYQLFNLKDIKASLNSIDQLLIQAVDLKKRISIAQLNILNLVQASIDFIEIILETKLVGKANIYSFANLNYIAANLRGSKAVITELASFIPQEALLSILHNYRSIEDILSHYTLSNGGYKSYNQLTDKDKMLIYSFLSRQAELLSMLRALLDIDVYYKY